MDNGGAKPANGKVTGSHWLGGKQQEDKTICTAKWGGAGERGECDGRRRENCHPVAGRATASSRVGQALGLLA